jgi:RNA polymerase sigma factor
MVIQRETLEERVIRSRGDNDLLNSLIKEFKPFIASVAQKRVGRYLEYGVDDELSVGLMAFREAVNSFKEGRAKFLSFARMVISMRLIDYFRKMDNNFEVLGDEDEGDLWDSQSVELYQLENDEEDLKAEVINYSALLSQWGIDLTELAGASPKNDDLKNEYQEIARMIAEDEVLLKNLMETKRLPIKEIEKEVQIHRKKVERGRIYIIAMVLAIKSGFSYMDIGRGGE